MSCSRGWKKNSLSNYFNEVPNVILILLSRANSKKSPLEALSMSSNDFKTGSFSRRQPKYKTKKGDQRWAVNRRFGLLKLIYMIGDL